jgi:hypothetical protein
MITSAAPKGLRRFVNQKCRECLYDPAPGNGTWRQQVEACTSNLCALFPVRPRPISHNNSSSIALEISGFDRLARFSDAASAERKVDES